jgi:hypothetical protein
VVLCGSLIELGSIKLAVLLLLVGWIESSSIDKANLATALQGKTPMDRLQQTKIHFCVVMFIKNFNVLYSGLTFTNNSLV